MCIYVRKKLVYTWWVALIGIAITLLFQCYYCICVCIQFQIDEDYFAFDAAQLVRFLIIMYNTDIIYSSSSPQGVITIQIERCQFGYYSKLENFCIIINNKI